MVMEGLIFVLVLIYVVIMVIVGVYLFMCSFLLIEYSNIVLFICL